MGGYQGDREGPTNRTSARDDNFATTFSTQHRNTGSNYPSFVTTAAAVDAADAAGVVTSAAAATT